MNSLVKNIAIGITAGVVTYHLPLIHHTVLLSKYKSLITLEQDGKVVWPSLSISDAVSKAIKDLNLPENENIAPFVTLGFDMFQAGTNFYKYGFAIGVPMTYGIDKIEDINTDHIKINRESVNWQSSHAKELLSSLILSEDAKQYAIAHSLLRIHYNEQIVNAICGAIIATTTWIASCIATNKLRKYNAQKPTRILTHSLIGLFGISAWIAQKDFYTNYLDNKIDKRLAEAGPEYVRGGKEYYEKLLSKNKCLRILSGEYGKKLYSESGNYYTFVRQKSKPLTHRRSFFESFLKEDVQS